MRVVQCSHDAISAGCPYRSEGTQGPGSPSLGLRSLGQRQEKVGRRAGASTPPRNVVQTYRLHRTFLFVLFPGAGSRPGRRHPFLVSPSKGCKRRRPRFPRPLLPAASGAACGARGMGALHNSHRSLRSLTSNRCNESVIEARDARAPPMPLRCSARAQGLGAGTHSGRRCARHPGAACSKAAQKLGPSAAMARMVPDPDPTPVTAPSSAVAGAAREVARFNI